MTSYLRYKQELRTVQDADDIESWITVRGNHIPIKKGQSKEDAVKSFLESKGGNSSAKGSSQKNELSIAYHKDKGHIKEGNPPKGWTKVEGATTAPNGYSWYSNNKSMFGKERESYLYKDEPQEQSKLNKGEPSKANPKNTAVEKLNANGGDAIGKWKPISSGSHYYFRDENHWAQRQGEYYYVPENDNEFENYATMEGDNFGRAFVTVHIYKNGKAVRNERFDDGGNNKVNNMNNAIDYIVDFFKYNKETKSESNNIRDPRPKDADAETINDVLFDKYVPKQGKADTLLGEQLRAINKIVYRYENDGDMYGNGYGVETVNAPIKFLQSVYEEKSIPGLSGILSSLKNAAKTNDTMEYEHNIQRLKNLMVNADWETLKKLANTKNDEDMYSFEDNTRYDDDEEEW